MSFHWPLIFSSFCWEWAGLWSSNTTTIIIIVEYQWLVQGKTCWYYVFLCKKTLLLIFKMFSFFFLFQFNDTLLYTTPVAGGYKLNNVLKLAGMKVITKFPSVMIIIYFYGIKKKIVIYLKSKLFLSQNIYVGDLD